MEPNSSNPPDLKKTTLHCGTPSCIPSSDPPSEQILVQNHDLRDVLVCLCQPRIKVGGVTNPKDRLVDLLDESFRARGHVIAADNLAEAVDTLIERDLICFHAGMGMFVPTRKAASIIDMLRIVICKHCGASCVGETENPDDLPQLMFCHACGEIIK